MPHFWRIFWGKFASSHHQYIPLPGPLAPPLSSRPSLKITALSYSWTTLQILLDLQIAINWFWCWPWSRRKGWRAAWQGPSPKRLGWGPARRGRLQTHSRRLRRWNILDIIFFTALGILAPLHKHLQSLSFYCILFLNSTCFFFTVSMRIAICCPFLKYKIWRSLNQSKFS